MKNSHILGRSDWLMLSVEQKRDYLAKNFRSEKSSDLKRDKIAIIGLSGRYPEADNIEQFWENLKQGRDCVKEIPSERWDWRSIYDPEMNTPHKCYSKHGSFISDVDKFDHLFFNISPREAEMMDPQERLLLEVAWAAIEDSGYDPRRFRQENHGHVGVFVGVMWNEYQLLNKEKMGLEFYFGNSNNSFLANRLSYYLDLSGPSLVVDTACSSSLVAIHMACENIWRGDCQFALAGGVNLSLHPSKYLNLSSIGMLSAKGRCRSFGAGGDGYVPGEGVGVVLLKPLQDALRDGNQIYGTILSSHINHGGKTNGFTVPNPDAQADLIKKALEKGALTADEISYIEGHGTGTSLGDPIEITGLCKAFGGSVPKQTCAIGSVKSNVGHLEGAAGIVALTKVLLQLKHKQLVPSLHSKQLNPNIELTKTPFYVQQELSEWHSKPGMPRRAGISSFGAGGSNAHLIVEEGPESILSTKQTKPYYLLTISSKHPDSLHQRIRDLGTYLDVHVDLPLEAIAYTLNKGRSHFEHRFAMVISSIAELKTTLKSAQQGQSGDHYLFSETKSSKNRDSEKLLKALLEEFSEKPIESANDRKKLLALAELYIQGYEIPWKILHHGESHQRVSLPTYPFLKKRHWASFIDKNQGMRPLHPLVGTNSSTLNEYCFTTVLTGKEFYLTDHIIGERKILPGAAYLEMARAAGDLILPGKKVHGLQDVKWIKPLVVDGKDVEVKIRLKPQEKQVQYFIYTELEGEEILHSQGTLSYEDPSELTAWSTISELEMQLAQNFTKGEIYSQFSKIGLHYGQAFQPLQWAKTNTEEVLAYVYSPWWINRFGSILFTSEHYRRSPPCLWCGCFN